MELEGDARYDPCEPGYAMFVEALGQVYCGDLDRYIELTGEVVRRYGSDRGYGLASYVDGLQSAGRIEEALALTEESVAAARRLGNPYWVAYALWIAGMAFSRTNALRALAAWEEGIAFVHEHRIGFFEGFIACDAARLHTSDGEPDVALGLFAEAIRAFHRAGNVPQLIITLASVPALFERLDRLEPAACCWARCRGNRRASTMSTNWPSSGTASPPDSARPRRANWSGPAQASTSTPPPGTPAGKSTRPAATPDPGRAAPARVV